jgi:hypothetical protein
VVELTEGVGPADQLQELPVGPLSRADRSGDLLSEDVEAPLRHLRGLDLSTQHASSDRGRVYQVGPVLGDDAAGGHLADQVARAAHPLQACRDALWALDLHHEVDRTDVYAELHRRGRDQRRQLP